MQISIKHDLKQAAQKLTRIQKQQIPFAASQAINDTAMQAQKAAKVQAEKKLDRPTKSTVNAIRVKRSTKRHLVGEVFILPWAWDYLKYQVEGGTRHAKGAGTGVPVNARLNRYGNIPSRKKGLVKNKRQFIATIGGVAGVWERSGRGGKQIKLIAAFEKQVKYTRRYAFDKIVQGIVNNKFKRNFEYHMARALLTAR